MSGEQQDDGPRICHQCIGEAYLSAEVFRQGELGRCEYCDTVRRSFTLETIADRVAGVMTEHFYRTRPDQTGFEYAMSKEGLLDWERDGEPTAIAIMNLAGIPERAGEDIQEILNDRHGDWEAAQMGDETEYSAGAHYAETKADIRDFEESWAGFERSIRTEARFFGPAAERVLSELFHDVHSLMTQDEQPVVRLIGPGRDIAKLHRARVFQSDAKLRDALADPERLIGTPASAFAANGRMNARGVPVFYGASSPEVALKEVRPPVGSRVVTAEFEILRPVHILDVAALQSIFVTGSLFDSEFGRLFNRAAFLSRLSDRIIMPVMPDDEATDYLVTQVMAEYLAHRVGLDGILYPSAQDAVGQFNVVLFHKASRVRPATTKAGDKIDVQTWQQDDKGGFPNYSIWTTRAPVDEIAPPRPFDLAGYLTALGPYPEGGYDDREETLCLDRTTLKVRHIEGVQVIEHAFAVYQHDFPAGAFKGQGLSIEDEVDI